MVGDLGKKFPVSACPKKNIACSTNVIESLWGKKGKKYPAHQIARKKKFLMTRNHPTLTSRIKWSAPYVRSFFPAKVIDGSFFYLSPY